jgi:hypothetical protein
MVHIVSFKLYIVKKIEKLLLHNSEQAKADILDILTFFKDLDDDTTVWIVK